MTDLAVQAVHQLYRCLEDPGVTLAYTGLRNIKNGQFVRLSDPEGTPSLQFIVIIPRIHTHCLFDLARDSDCEVTRVRTLAFGSCIAIPIQNFTKTTQDRIQKAARDAVEKIGQPPAPPRPDYSHL